MEVTELYKTDADRYRMLMGFLHDNYPDAWAEAAVLYGNPESSQLPPEGFMCGYCGETLPDDYPVTGHECAEMARASTDWGSAMADAERLREIHSDAVAVLFRYRTPDGAEHTETVRLPAVGASVRFVVDEDGRLRREVEP